jgi:hypothetical protein
MILFWSHLLKVMVINIWIIYLHGQICNMGLWISKVLIQILRLVWQKIFWKQDQLVVNFDVVSFNFSIYFQYIIVHFVPHFWSHCASFELRFFFQEIKKSNAFEIWNNWIAKCQVPSFIKVLGKHENNGCPIFMVCILINMI